MSGLNRDIELSTDDNLDASFVKLNMYYLVAKDSLLRKILLHNMKQLSTEVIKRDGTKEKDFVRFFKTLELSDVRGN